jgi:hypothetical protein
VLYPYRQTPSPGLHSWNSDPAAIVIDKLEATQMASAMAALPEESLIVATSYFVERVFLPGDRWYRGIPCGNNWFTASSRQANAAKNSVEHGGRSGRYRGSSPP